MTPLEIALENAAEWVREILNTHWTVLLLPLFGAVLFLAGLMTGISASAEQPTNTTAGTDAPASPKDT